MNSKEKILEVAIKLFAEKGKHGTRMENIAAGAGVNKAMTYYYYTSKDYLYQEVIINILQSIYQSIYHALEKTPQNDKNPVTKVKTFLAAHFQAFLNQKSYTKIILDALANEPEQLHNAFEALIKNWGKNIPQEMLETFEQGVALGVFRDINYKHIMISIIGMNLIYYFGKSISQVLLKLEVDDEQTFLKEREESNIDLLLHGILTKGGQDD
jgi:AcrR family transcriptional regulator